jgi:hypothetical protein
MLANPATVAAAFRVFLYGSSGETMSSDSLLEQLGPVSALLHGAGPLPVSRLTDQFQAPQALSQTGIVDMACCLQPNREGTFLLRAGYKRKLGNETGCPWRHYFTFWLSMYCWMTANGAPPAVAPK